jgi:hypothetical protein
METSKLMGIIPKGKERIVIFVSAFLGIIMFALYMKSKSSNENYDTYSPIYSGGSSGGGISSDAVNTIDTKPIPKTTISFSRDYSTNFELGSGKSTGSSSSSKSGGINLAGLGKSLGLSSSNSSTTPSSSINTLMSGFNANVFDATIEIENSYDANVSAIQDWLQNMAGSNTENILNQNMLVKAYQDAADILDVTKNSSRASTIRPDAAVQSLDAILREGRIKNVLEQETQKAKNAMELAAIKQTKAIQKAAA